MIYYLVRLFVQSMNILKLWSGLIGQNPIAMMPTTLSLQSLQQKCRKVLKMAVPNECKTNTIFLSLLSFSLSCRLSACFSIVACSTLAFDYSAVNVGCSPQGYTMMISPSIPIPSNQLGRGGDPVMQMYKQFFLSDCFSLMWGVCCVSRCRLS